MMKPRLAKVWKGSLCLATVVLLLTAFGGCAQQKEAATELPEPMPAAAAPAVVTAKSERSASGGAMNLAAPPSADQVANSSAAALVAPTMVIRNGVASIEVDSLEVAIAAVQRLASSLGGYVGNTSLMSGAYAVRSAELQLKIPSSRYDAAVGSLAPIGKVESQTSTAEDVGEEFVDVTARQNNAHKLEERLIALLATRTGKLEDVLAVERELARVREAIERYEGRLRYLKSHVATSTLTVTVHERTPVVAQYTGKNVIVESFKNAWTIFVQFIAFFISSLGWIIPVGVIVAIATVVTKRYRNKRRASPIIRRDDSGSPKP